MAYEIENANGSEKLIRRFERAIRVLRKSIHSFAVYSRVSCCLYTSDININAIHAEPRYRIRIFIPYAKNWRQTRAAKTIDPRTSPQAPLYGKPRTRVF